MLQRQKDYWKKKAEVDFIQARNDQERAQAMEVNQRRWAQRVNESEWLLPNAEEDPARKFYKEARGGAGTNGKRRKKGSKDKKSKSNNNNSGGNNGNTDDSEGEVDNSEDNNNNNSSSNARSERKSSKASSASTNGLFSRIMKIIKPEKKKKKTLEITRIRYADIVEKEAEMQEMMLADERRKRFDVLVESSSRLRVLSAVRQQLTMQRMPAHHRTTDKMQGFANDNQISEKVREENLGNHRKQPMRDRIIEDLASWEEITENENKAMRFSVPARLHQYQGEHRLFPLKKFPATVDALLPAGSASARDKHIPEYRVLPNVEEENRIAEEKLRKKRKEGIRIHRERLNMSRDAAKRESRLREIEEVKEHVQEREREKIARIAHPPSPFLAIQPKRVFPEIATADISIDSFAPEVRLHILETQRAANIGRDRLLHTR